MEIQAVKIAEAMAAAMAVKTEIQTVKTAAKVHQVPPIHQVQAIPQITSVKTAKTVKSQIKTANLITNWTSRLMVSRV